MSGIHVRRNHQYSTLRNLSVLSSQTTTSKCESISVLHWSSCTGSILHTEQKPAMYIEGLNVLYIMLIFYNLSLSISILKSQIKIVSSIFYFFVDISLILLLIWVLYTFDGFIRKLIQLRNAFLFLILMEVVTKLFCAIIKSLFIIHFYKFTLNKYREHYLKGNINW